MTQYLGKVDLVENPNLEMDDLDRLVHGKSYSEIIWGHPHVLGQPPNHPAIGLPRNGVLAR